MSAIGPATVTRRDFLKLAGAAVTAAGLAGIPPSPAATAAAATPTDSFRISAKPAITIDQAFNNLAWATTASKLGITDIENKNSPNVSLAFYQYHQGNLQTAQRACIQAITELKKPLSASDEKLYGKILDNHIRVITEWQNTVRQYPSVPAGNPFHALKQELATLSQAEHLSKDLKLKLVALNTSAAGLNIRDPRIAVWSSNPNFLSTDERLTLLRASKGLSGEKTIRENLILGATKNYYPLLLTGTNNKHKQDERTLRDEVSSIMLLLQNEFDSNAVAERAEFSRRLENRGINAQISGCTRESITFGTPKGLLNSTYF